MSENTTPGGDPIPPKLNLRQDNPLLDLVNAARKERDEKHHTARIDLPETPPEVTNTLKKKTSRIPLDQVSAEPGAAAGSPVAGIGASKTIRLTNPSSSTPTITIAPSPKAMSVAMMQDDAKRQTSRIPLESATPGSGDGSDGQAAIPKTIRIKRPMVTQAIPLAPAPVPPPPSQEPPFAPKSSTSRIDLPKQEVTEEGQVTQRKTIKIRRADGDAVTLPGPRSPVVARLEQEAAAQAAETVSAPHPVFPVLAAVALVLLCVLVYVLCVQAFPDLHWSFPGKVTL